MNLKLEIEFSKADLLQEVDALKKQIDDMRPLPDDVEGRVMQKLRLDWNYHSNAIEGNKLTYGETIAFLMEGITAKGKPLKDHLDIRGHNEAINFLLSIVKEARPISEVEIRALHKMILVESYDVPAQTAEGVSTRKRISIGEYKSSANHVKTATGEIHYYAAPEDTPAKMQELMEWYGEVSNDKDIHPIVVAALFHHKFVAIHPFDDGNGRLSRILMNLILMQKGYPPVVIKMDDRQNYYSLLSRADNGDSWPFIEYIIERLRNSLQIYLKAASGGEIEEDDDIDKKINLFKQSLIRNENEKISTLEIYKVFQETVFPLIARLIEKTITFNDLFVVRRNEIIIKYLNLIYDTELSFNSTNLQSTLAFPFQKEFRIKSVAVEIKFSKYKHKKNDKFDVEAQLNIYFYDDYYSIADQFHKIQIKKEYNQKLTKKEEMQIITEIVNNIMDDINLFTAF